MGTQKLIPQELFFSCQSVYLPHKLNRTIPNIFNLLLDFGGFFPHSIFTPIYKIDFWVEEALEALQVAEHLYEKGIFKEECKVGSSLSHMNSRERRVVEQFRKTLKSRLGEQLLKMSVFGSKVRGDFRETSDIDILVVVKGRTVPIMDQVAEVTADLNLEYNLSLAPVIFSEREYEMNEKMASPFTLAVSKEGVLL